MQDGNSGTGVKDLMVWSARTKQVSLKFIYSKYSSIIFNFHFKMRRKIYKYTKYIHLQSCHFLQECALLIFHCLTSPLGTRSRRRPPGASETGSKIREGRLQIIAVSLLYWFKYAFGNNWCMNTWLSLIVWLTWQT